MQKSSWILLALMGALGCASRPVAVQPPPRPLTDAEQLLSALSQQTWGREQTLTLARLDSVRSIDWVNDNLADISMDTLAPQAARVNALLQLGERHYVTDFRIYREAARAPDSILRSASMVAVGNVLPLDEGAIDVLRRGLADASMLVQAKALQSLSDADPSLLRSYLARSPSLQLRSVAEDLLRVAEERGAPLADSAALVASGNVSRTSSAGHRVDFRASKHWPRWQAAVGELWVAAKGGEMKRVADKVEMVAGVVPAFFSKDGAFLIYEADRTIFIRNLATGATRTVGKGSAPRSVPFADTFIYVAEQADGRQESTDGTRIRYTVMMGSFANTEGARALGSLTATTRTSLFGAYSPVRWMRIRERFGTFNLEARSMEPYRLPDPFGGESTN
jgi:hypothetical protein